MSTRKDLPNPNAPNFLQRVREEIHALLGKTGSARDRALTLADAINSGVIGVGPGGSLVPGPATGETYEPDLTPPPTPTGFAVDAAISHVFIEHDPPLYRQGHGHLRTRVYGVTHTAGDPLPVFADAVEVGQFEGTVWALPSNPSTTWHLWIKWETRDGVLSASPAGGTNGLSTTTGQDVTLLLDALAGQIGGSQLANDLATPIGKIPALESGLAQEAIDRAQAVADEASARAAALAQEASDRAGAIQAAADAAASDLSTEIGNRVAAIQQVDTDLRAALATADAAVVSSLTSAFQSADAATLASAQSYTFSKTEINNAISAMGTQLTTNFTAADAATLASAQNFTYSRSAIDAADAATLSTLRSEFAAADSTTLATAQNYTYSRATIDSAIASSASTLRSQLTGGSTATDLNALTSGLLYQMRETSAAQDAALAQQITLLSAGAGEQFDYSNIWYYDSGIESWTTNGTGSTLSAVSGWLRLVSNSGTLTDRYFISPDNLGINGAKYPQVRLRLRKVGNPTWEGRLYFITTANATYDGTKSATIAEPSYDANGISVVTFDMPASWTGATIRQIRFDASPAITPTDYFELDWVAVGRPSPGASSAQLTALQTAMMQADDALVQDVTDLQADLSTLAGDVATKASASALSALETRVTSAEGVNTSQGSAITSLQNSLTTTNNTVATKADASALSALTTRVTSAEGTITSHGTRLNTLESTVNNPTTGVAATAAALDVVETLVNNSTTGVTATANKTALLESKLSNVRDIFVETWDGPDPLSRWQSYSGPGERSIVAAADTVGGKALRVGNNAGDDQAWLVHQDLIPFDPNKLYRMRVRVRRTNGDGVIYIGWAGVAADGTTLVNAATGANTSGGQHYHCVGAVAPAASWVEYTGYTKGFGATAGTQGAGSLASPGKMHPNVRYLRALVLVNYSSKTGITEVGPLVVDDAEVKEVEAGLNTSIATKADASALSALTTTVTNQGNTITAQGNSITTLQGQMTTVQNGLTNKADASALSALETRVTNAEGVNTSQGSSITSLTNSLATTNTNVSTAQTTANNAATAAANAQTSANTANTALADIASDSKLTPVEKQAVRSEWNVVSAEKAGINTQATTFGITTENTAYNNAFQALATYLNNGTTYSSGVPSWISDANLGTTTNIVGATFRTNWQTLYTARTALLNRIALKAKELADAAQTTANSKADASAVSALTTRVTTAEGSITSQGSAITGLQNSVSTINGTLASKADVSALNSLSTTVTNQGNTLTAQGTSITALQSQVASTQGERLYKNFEGGVDLWTTSRTGLPTSVASASGTLVTDDPDFGACGRFTNFTTGGNALGPKEWMPVRPGRVYRLRCRFKIETMATAGSMSFTTVVGCHNAAGAVVGDGSAFSTNNSGTLTSTGVYQIESLFSDTASSGVAAFDAGTVLARPLLRLNTAGTGSVIRVQFLEFVDITEERDLTASVQTEATTRASETGELFAKYTVKVDVAGHVSGYGLASEENNGAVVSRFGIRADQFFIAPPATSSATAPTTNLYKGRVWVDTSVTPNVTRYYTGSAWSTTPQALPFVVQTSATTVNGVSVPPGVYMDDAYIKNGTITNAKIANLAVDDAKIANLSVSKLTAGSIAVGQYAQSTGYVAGSSGWRINGDGTAEFSGVVVRGTIFASQGAIGGWTIGSNYLQSTTYVLGTSGTRFNSDGTGQIGGITIYSQGLGAGSTAYDTGAGAWVGRDGRFSLRNSAGTQYLKWNGSSLQISGALQAATGTFAGSLSAATGTFSGALSAATGTFSGSLTADAVNAVNTINLAGNAVSTSSAAGGGSTIYVATSITIPPNVTARVSTIGFRASKATGFSRADVTTSLSLTGADTQNQLVYAIMVPTSGEATEYGHPSVIMQNTATITTGASSQVVTATFHFQASDNSTFRSSMNLFLQGSWR